VFLLWLSSCGSAAIELLLASAFLFFQQSASTWFLFLQ
jgi:hypothetical protein